MKDALNSLAWPIWAVRMGEIIYDMWWWLSYLWFAGMLSLALAIFNVLPIPVLDWWRAIWMILQKITRINPKKFFVWEAYVDMVFMYLLVLLGLIIAVKDFYVYYRDAIVDYWNIIFNYITGAI
jgi:membrane-associated protease RseP (regulator of RpoE activity)